MKQIRLISFQKSRRLKLMTISILTSFSVFSQTPPNQQNALNPTGNVGVGTMNPDSKLQVNGSMSIDSSLTVRDSAIFQKQARMKDKVIVEGEAIIQGKLTAQDNLKVLGTTRIEGPLKLLNLNNVQSGDTTLLFINSNGKVKAGGPIALMDIMYPGPLSIDPCGGTIINDRPIWFNKPNVLWTGDPCPSIVKVGIGIADPLSTLDVRGDGYFSRELSVGGFYGTNSFGKLYLANTDKPATLQIDAIGNTNNYSKLIFMQYDAENTAILNAVKGSSSTSTFVVNGDGSFFLYNPYTNRKLLQMDEGGVLKSREIYVDLQTWPDYVFKQDYTLQPLSEVATYIQDNGHLPNVPSAQEIEKSGLNVAEANKILMQKVEELTLYLIKQEETIKKQEAELKQIQEKLAKITPNN